MRTTLNIDDHIFNDLLRITKAKTKTAAVTTALTEYLRIKRKEKVIALRGNLDILDNWQESRLLDFTEYDEDQNDQGFD